MNEFALKAHWSYLFSSYRQLEVRKIWVLLFFLLFLRLIKCYRKHVNGMSVIFSSTTPLWKEVMNKMAYALLFLVCIRKKTNEGLGGSVMLWYQHAANSADPCMTLTSCSFSKGQVSKITPCSGWDQVWNGREIRVSWRLMSSWLFTLNQSVIMHLLASQRDLTSWASL